MYLFFSFPAFLFPLFIINMIFFKAKSHSYILGIYDNCLYGDHPVFFTLCNKYMYVIYINKMIIIRKHNYLVILLCCDTWSEVLADQ